MLLKNNAKIQHFFDMTKSLGNIFLKITIFLLVETNVRNHFQKRETKMCELEFYLVVILRTRLVLSISILPSRCKIDCPRRSGAD